MIPNAPWAVCKKLGNNLEVWKKQAIFATNKEDVDIE